VTRDLMVILDSACWHGDTVRQAAVTRVAMVILLDRLLWHVLSW